MSSSTCHNQSGGRTKPASHQKIEKVYCIIQIGFDCFPLQQKSKKNEHIFFPKMHIQFQIGILFAERINLSRDLHFFCLLFSFGK